MNDINLDGNLSTGLTIPPNHLKDGLTDNYTQSEIKYSRLLTAGNSKLQAIQLKYMRSYTSRESNRTLLHWRDLLFSLVIGLITRNCLSYDINNSELTTLAYHFYRTRNIEDTWRKDLRKVKKGKLYSNFPSLSYFFKDLDVDLNFPISSVDTLINYLIKEYTSEFYSFKNAHDEYTNFILGDTEKINELQEYLTDVYRGDISDRPTLKFLKNNLLVPQDWSYLSLRLLMGEYRRELRDIVDDGKEIEDRLFSRVSPLSSLGFYLLLTSKGLIEICKVISEQSIQIQNLYIGDLFVEDVDNDIKKTLYDHLFASVNSYFYISWFNSFKESKNIYIQLRQIFQNINLSNYSAKQEFILV